MSMLLIDISSSALKNQNVSVGLKRVVREVYSGFGDGSKLFKSFDESQDDIDNFVFEFGALKVGDRLKDDLDDIQNTINEYSSIQSSLVIFGTKEEFDNLPYKRLNKIPNYHFLRVVIQDSQFCLEECEVFKPMFNNNEDFYTNAQRIGSFYLTSESSSILSKSDLNQKILHQTTKEITENALICSHVLDLSQQSGQNIGKGLSDTISKIEQNINENIIASTTAVNQSYKIIQEISKENEYQIQNIGGREIIKYPTTFNENQMELSHIQSGDWADHVFTIKNKTSYVWKNLSIIFVQNNSFHTDFNHPYYGKRLTEISEVLPHETITVKVGYDDQLIEDHGFYKVQLFYHSRPISNKIDLASISVISHSIKGTIASLEVQNGIKTIQSSKIIYTNTQSNLSKTINQKLNARRIEKINIQVAKGETYEIRFFKDKESTLNLCEPYILTVA